MAIFSFGKQKKIEDFNIKDLRKEIINEEVEQDQLRSLMRRAQERYDSLMEAASEPGLMDVDIQIAAQKMDRAEKDKLQHESDLQLVSKNIDVLDSMLRVVENKEDLERKGIWDELRKMDPSELEKQIKELATMTRGDRENIDTIADTLGSGINEFDVNATKTAGQRRAEDIIRARRAEKS